MSLIQVKHVTFSYEGSYDLIFDDVSFQIDTDWKLGLVGRNGRGKTTFLKLLMKQMEYSGSITSNVEFDYFPFSLENAEETVIAAAYRIYPDMEYWQLVRELSRLQMTEDVLERPFSTLSGGERTKALLAILFLKENHFLLIDEPTNHLDTRTRQLVGSYLAKKKGFILVSHDRAFLDASVDHILAIDKTKITITRGNFSSWFENKQRQDQFEQRENARLLRDIHRIKEAAGQTKSWADEAESTKIGKKAFLKQKTTGKLVTRAYVGEKSRKMQQRRKNLEKRQERAIEEKSQLLKDVETAEDLKWFPGVVRTKKDSPVIRIKMPSVNFEVYPGEQVLLQGRNGCGKTSILKNILRKTTNLTVSYVPQDASYLFGGFRQFAKTLEEENGVDMSLLFSVLRKLGMERDQFEKQMEEFSEGQKKKVLLAKSLCEQADLYLWDEPLNYIDIYSRMQIEKVIENVRPTMILVEHDERFAETIAAKAVKMV